MAGTTDDHQRSARRTLIINADDFGMSVGINRGIIEAAAAGSVTSTSLMVGMPAFDDAVAAARSAAGSLGVGLHLTLTVGRPLTPATSLVDRDTGDFLPMPELLARAVTGRIDPAEVADECRAQIARARRAGVALTHLDGHLHVHLLPGVSAAVKHVAAAERIPVIRRPAEPLFGIPLWWRRLPERLLIAALASRPRFQSWPVATTDHFIGSILLGAREFEAGLLRVLDALPLGTTELMVHPGYSGPPLPGNDRYDAAREIELRALTSTAVLERLREGDVQLVDFRYLRSHGANV